MFYQVSALVIILLIHPITVSSQQSPNVAIVGAGIGGAATSYYLHKFSNMVGVNVFESRNYIGGRINEITFGGVVEEIGADAWSDVNYYIQHIAEDLGLAVSNSSTDTYAGNGFTAIWGPSFIDWQKLALLYPLVDACIGSQIAGFTANLTENYIQRGAQAPFTTIDEFLNYGGMYKYADISTTDFLLKCNATQQYLDVLVAPITRAIYDQELNIQAFAGEVSLVSLATPAFWVTNGNSQLPKQMFAKAEANVMLNTQITSISYDGSKFSLRSPNTTSVTYADVVVIAAPFEKIGISFNNITFNAPIVNRDFVNCYVTHVEATGTNPVYFGLQPGDRSPDSVLTTPESTLPFTILGVEAPSVTTPGAKIYKLFSNSDISNVLNQIFLNISDTHVQVWPYTFPILNPTSSYQPVVLADNLYYLNTIESAASAMEASVISGRNAAQLILGHDV